jgi:hypothetical protein
MRSTAAIRAVNIEELAVRGHGHLRKESVVPRRDLSASLAKTTAGILAKSRDPARVLEFYYWSRQPGLVELIRAFLALPEKTRKSLDALLVNASDPWLISVRAGKNGCLTLAAGHPPAGRKAKSSR